MSSKKVRVLIEIPEETYNIIKNDSEHIPRNLDLLRRYIEEGTVLSDKYEYHIDHTDCIWYGSDGGCPCTCSQYRDGWNDAMEYIFKNGKGYQPYRRDIDG